MAAEIPTDRRIGSTRLASVLGAWHRPGASYVALADGLRAAVLSGAVPLSTRLPSERELAVALGISRTTTSAAYDTLREEGFLASRRGSGTVTTLPAGAAPAGGPARFPTPGRDDDVIDLSIAAPSAPRELHAASLAALDALPAYLGSHGYDPFGLPVLREAIAARYTARGVPTTPDQILVTTGAQNALTVLFSAHAGPGDRVVVEHPTYPHALEAVRSAGARPVPVPSGPDGLDLDLLESTVRQSAPRLVYLIPDNRNPTGTSLSDDDRARVRSIARRHRTVVLGDEVLTDLTLDGPTPEPFAGDGTASGLVVSVGSASKSFWGGLRVGWVRAHPEMVARLARVRGRIDIAGPVLDQLVTAELLRDPQDLLARRRTELRVRRDHVIGLLAEHLPGWTVPTPRGGLALWADLGAPTSSALAAVALRHGVRLAPGPAFGVDGSFERFLRVPYTEPLERLDLAVAGVAAAWADLGRMPGAAQDAPDPVRAVV